jgi:mono/diheme cytochrome c family protein
LKVLLVGSALLLLAAAPRFFPLRASSQIPVSVWDGVYTEAQARRGAAFGAKNCAGCHGIDLNSGEPGPWLYGEDFALRYDAHTMEDLARRLRTMPPDNPGGFGAEATADFAAFVLWTNDFPVGPRELPGDLAALRRIRITIKRP